MPASPEKISKKSGVANHSKHATPMSNNFNTKPSGLVEELQIDRQQACRHLELSGHTVGVDDIYIRAFFKSKNGDKGRKCTGLDWQQIEPWQREGRGIYYVVNGQGHAAKDVKVGLAIFYEHDDLPKEQQLTLYKTLGLPEPTLQVDTGNKSIHSYWVFNEPIPIDQRQSLQIDLIEFTKSDKSVKDPSRVMRLAGCINPETGEMVKIVSDSGKRYTYEELRAVIPEPVKEEPKPKQRIRPLTDYLTRKDKQLLSSPSSEGSRNNDGTALARNLIGTERRLGELGFDFAGSALDLWDSFWQGCTPPLDREEADGIWQSAMKDNPSPSLTDDVLRSIANWERQVSSQSASRRNDKNDTPSANALGQEIAEEYRDRLAYNNENQTWYRYEAEHPGVWSDETIDYVEAIVDNIVESKGLDVPPSYVSAVITKLRRKLIERHWNERQDLLPCRNGVLDPSTKKLLPHSPGYRFTWCLPRSHDSEATDWSVIDEWLDFATSNNKALKETLIAFAAATLTGTAAQFQKFLHLVGIGGSGKGTFSRLLVDLIGLENCHTSTLEDWGGNRFEPAQAYRKRLLLFPDEDRGVKSLGKFKQVTGGDWLRAEEKNKKPFKFKFDGAVVVASNFPIFGSDNSSGMSRRTISVPFNAVVARTARCDLNAKFQAYLPAFTNYLLSLDADWIAARLKGVQDIPEIGLQFWENQMRENSIAGFLNDKIIYDTTAQTLVGDNKEKSDTLYGAYYAYCEAQGHRPQAVKNFSPNLLELATTVLGWTLKKEHTKVGNTILGLRLREPSDEHLATYDFELRSRCKISGEGFGEGSVKDSVKGQDAYGVSVSAPVKDKTSYSLENFDEVWEDVSTNIETEIVFSEPDVEIYPSPNPESLQQQGCDPSPDPSPHPSPDPSPVNEALSVMEAAALYDEPSYIDRLVDSKGDSKDGFSEEVLNEASRLLGKRSPEAYQKVLGWVNERKAKEVVTPKRFSPGDWVEDKNSGNKFIVVDDDGETCQLTMLNGTPLKSRSPSCNLILIEQQQLGLPLDLPSDTGWNERGH